MLVLENREAVTVVERIVEEDKEHVAALLRLIERFDSAQADEL